MKIHVVVAGLLLWCSVGCSGTGGTGVESTGLVGSDESVPAPEHALRECVKAAARLETAAAVNLREAPSTEASLLLVLPEGSELSAASGASCPENGFYKVRFGGFEGWAHGAWLRASVLESAITYGNTRDEAIDRAKTGVGFSYWWGHGRWLASGATSTTKGACTGGCPSCSHSGSYGADCSGFAAKVWVVPSSNNDVAVDSHPYSTYNFENEYYGWHNVSRGSIQRADAMVYNDGGGHIFIYEKGDPWGSMYAYECRGCADGCVYGLRPAGSAYKAIGRDNMTNPTPTSPVTFNGGWHLRNANSGGTVSIPSFTYGTDGDIPVVGDWDGNGTKTVGIYRPSTREWHLRNANSGGTVSIPAFVFGTAGDLPVVGDWDGNGTDTIGIYRPATREWHLRNANSSGTPSVVFAFGGEEDVPVVGDWDGNGTDTIGLYRQATREWHLRNTNSSGTANTVFSFGGVEDVPVVGDWDGNGTTTVGVYRPGTREWHLRNANSSGTPSIPVFSFGGAEDLPVVGDWDGNGTTTIGVTR